MPVSTLMMTPNAALGGLLDDLVAHAIAFADAVRHVVVGLAAAQLQRGLQDDDRGGAVHVVVAIDENGLAAFDGRAQALHRRAQAGHQVGRVQVVQRGIEKLLGLLRVLDAARRQQTRHGDRQAHLQGQPLHMLRIGVAKDPAHVSVRRPDRCRRWPRRRSLPPGPAGAGSARTTRWKLRTGT